jgi:hypothetical protein
MTGIPCVFGPPSSEKSLSAEFRSILRPPAVVSTLRAMPRHSTPAQLLHPVVPPQPERLRPPATLSEGAKGEFIRIVLCEKPDHFRQSDLPLLCQYCESVALATRATVELQRDDAPARWLTLWEKANRNMVALAARLRLCPQSRQPNNPSRKPPERASFYDRVVLEEGDGSEQPD